MSDKQQKLKYVHLRSAEGNGVTSIGYQWDKDTGNVFYQFSRCSPRDVFCKRKAHLICEGRMFKHGPAGEFSGIKNEEELMKEFENLHPDMLRMAFEVKEVARASREAKEVLHQPAV
jgi:hypothetical protein